MKGGARFGENDPAYEKNTSLQSVIDAVHARYAARQLSDDEAEWIAAAGRPEAALPHKNPKDELK